MRSADDVPLVPLGILFRDHLSHHRIFLFIAMLSGGKLLHERHHRLAQFATDGRFIFWKTWNALLRLLNTRRRPVRFIFLRSIQHQPKIAAGRTFSSSIERGYIVIQFQSLRLIGQQRLWFRDRRHQHRSVLPIRWVNPIRRGERTRSGHEQQREAAARGRLDGSVSAKDRRRTLAGIARCNSRENSPRRQLVVVAGRI